MLNFLKGNDDFSPNLIYCKINEANLVSDSSTLVVTSMHLVIVWSLYKLSHRHHECAMLNWFCLPEESAIEPILIEDLKKDKLFVKLQKKQIDECEALKRKQTKDRQSMQRLHSMVSDRVAIQPDKNVDKKLKKTRYICKLSPSLLLLTFLL